MPNTFCAQNLAVIVYRCPKKLWISLTISAAFRIAPFGLAKLPPLLCVADSYTQRFWFQVGSRLSPLCVSLPHISLKLVSDRLKCRKIAQFATDFNQSNSVIDSRLISVRPDIGGCCSVFCSLPLRPHWVSGCTERVWLTRARARVFYVCNSCWEPFCECYELQTTSRCHPPDNGAHTYRTRY